MATTGGTAPSFAFAQIELAAARRGPAATSEAAPKAFPRSAHAAHIRGHLFYELGEREAGLAFLQDWMKDYSREGLMRVHNNWHLALWSMETGRHEQAWRVYDDALSPPPPGDRRSTSRPIARPSSRAPRWRAKRASPSGGASLRTYNTKWFGPIGSRLRRHAHGAGTTAMAGDSEVLARFIESPKGATADMLTPMAHGFEAYAQGDWARAAREIEPLLDTHERLGGGRAQRDLLEYSGDVGNGESRPRWRGARDDRKAPATERQGQRLPARGALEAPCLYHRQQQGK